MHIAMSGNRRVRVVIFGYIPIMDDYTSYHVHIVDTRGTPNVSSLAIIPHVHDID